MGVAGAVDRLVQFCIPLALVRLLDASEFGQYKLFWLIANTVMLFAALGMPNSLLFFLPRSDSERKKEYVYQTLAVLLFTGGIGALFTGPWSPFLPHSIQGSPVDSYLLPVFVFIWVVSSLIEILPSADQNIRWQVGSMLALTLVRALCIVLTVAVTRDMGWLILALVIFACLRLLLLLYYAGCHHGFRPSRIHGARLAEQMRYAVPFGLSAGLYNIRNQAEQWVVAFLFNAEVFATYAISISIAPLIGVLRKPVRYVLLPKMSRAQAEGNVAAVLSLNNKGNLAVSSLLFPLLAFLFAFADPIVELLFTKAYSNAVPIMRIYIIGMARMGVEIASVLVVFSQGRFVMIVNGILVFLSVVGSYWGATIMGLSGAVLGSVVSIYIVAIIHFVRAGRLTNIPVRKMQDWQGLAVLACSAVIAAIVSLWAVDKMFYDDLIPLKLIAGMLVYALVYTSLLFCMGRGWLLSVFFGKGTWRTV